MSGDVERPGRRAILRATAALAVWPSAARLRRRTQEENALDGVLDRALTDLHRTSPVNANGNANHPPMACECLEHLGRSESIADWRRADSTEHAPRPAASRAIEGAEWRGALGDRARLGDWLDLFERAVERRPWRSVLDEWAPRLAAGIVGAAGHGWIRTAHAARALQRVDNATRRRELAHGLAYWATAHHELPVIRSTGTPRVRPEESFSRLPLVAVDDRLARGNLTDRLAPLDDDERFHRAMGSLDLAAPVEPLVDELLTCAAGFYSRNVESNMIVAIHAVTMAAALRSVLPVVGESARPELLGGAWRAVAAFASAFGVSEDRRVISRRQEFELDPLVTRAAEARNAHALKLLDACAVELGRRDEPAFRDVAFDVVERYER